MMEVANGRDTRRVKHGKPMVSVYVRYVLRQPDLLDCQVRLSREAPQ